jgi:hypothetical protein
MLLRLRGKLKARFSLAPGAALQMVAIAMLRILFADHVELPEPQVWLKDFLLLCQSCFATP